jgi:hypothetical protein
VVWKRLRSMREDWRILERKGVRGHKSYSGLSNFCGTEEDGVYTFFETFFELVPLRSLVS